MAVFNKLHHSLKSYTTGLFHDYCAQCALLVGYETLSHSLLREAMEVDHEMYRPLELQIYDQHGNKQHCVWA